ncbi:MAG: hypothetical protein ABIG20_04415 [archaeon]
MSEDIERVIESFRDALIKVEKDLTESEKDVRDAGEHFESLILALNRTDLALTAAVSLESDALASHTLMQAPDADKLLTKMVEAAKAAKDLHDDTAKKIKDVARRVID